MITECSRVMHILTVKNADKAALEAIFDRNGIIWKEHRGHLSGRDPNTGAHVDPYDPDLDAHIEILMGWKEPS